MHDEIRINRFYNKYDNAVKNEGEYRWRDLVEFFSQHDLLTSKDVTQMFNSVRYDDVSDIRQHHDRVEFDDNTYELCTRRMKQNIQQVDALVIDYDGELTIGAAKRRFKDYEYLAYTSYNHRVSTKVQKFRLIFPLSEPIPVRRPEGELRDFIVYGDLTDALKSFAGPCDPVIDNPNQLYYLPSTHPDRSDLIEAWHNKGVVLDWRQWSRNAVMPEVTTKEYFYGARSNEKFLDPETKFKHKKGIIRAKEVTKRISKVVCPFHDDVAGGETITRFEDSGIIAFRCKRCGVFVLPPDRIQAPLPITSAESTTATADSGDVIDRVFGFDFFYEGAEDRNAVKQTLKIIKGAITGDMGLATAGMGVDKLITKHFVGYKSHLIAMPEGAGKSQLALDLVLSKPFETKLEDGTPVRRPYRVVFACRSWEQVFEQHDNFAPKLAEHGLCAAIAYSHEGLLRRRFSITGVRALSYGFDTRKLDHDKTRQRIYEREGISQDGEPADRKKQIDLTLAFLLSESATGGLGELCQYNDLPVRPEDTHRVVGRPGKEKLMGPSMVFTTFARLRLIGLIDYLLPDWVVWIDDPDIDDLLDIERIEPGKWQKLSESTKKKTIEINGTRYFQRPTERSLGHSTLRHRCIYTTTETLTLNRLMQLLSARGESYLVHDYRDQVRGGRITILGTDKVRKSFDALIPLLIEQIAKEAAKKDKRIRLVADGLGAEFNHSNIKGRNDLTTNDLVIELSKPHAFKVKTLNDAIGGGLTPDPALGKAVMLDRLHQAIGRNSGYRTKDAECVVLVDCNDHRHLVENCRYAAVDRNNSVLVDKTQNMSRKESRLRDDASPLAKALEQALNNPYEYLLDERKSKADIRRVVKAIADADKRKAYLARLLYALTHLCGWRIDKSSTPSLNVTQGKVLALGRWIVDNVILDTEKKAVLKQYDALFKPEDDLPS